MTFALLGRCPETGQLGVAVTTSDLAVGARVPFALAGVAVAVTQHRTDPRLGPRALELVRSGCTPQEAVDAVAASTPHRDWRQVAVLTADGTHAAYNGAGVTPEVAALPGDDCLAVGNMLVGDAIAPAMVAGFARAGGPLARIWTPARIHCGRRSRAAFSDSVHQRTSVAPGTRPSSDERIPRSRTASVRDPAEARPASQSTARRRESASRTRVEV